MENPNAYDDEKFLAAEQQLQEAVHSLWGAGATREQIESAFTNYCEGEIEGAPWNE